MAPLARAGRTYTVRASHKKRAVCLRCMTFTSLSPPPIPPRLVSSVFPRGASSVSSVRVCGMWYIFSHALALTILCSQSHRDTAQHTCTCTCTCMHVHVHDMCMCMHMCMLYACHVFSPPMCNVQCAMSTCSTTPTVENSRPSFTRDPCTLVNPDARSRCYPISRVTIPRKRRRGVSAPLQQGSAPPKARTMRTATSAANLPAAARSLRAPRRR